MQKSIRRDISAVLLKNYCNACEIRKTISSKYYILFLTIIVILLVYSTVCSDVIIVLHQDRGL